MLYVLTWVHQCCCALLCIQHGQLREAYVIADANAQPPGWRVYHSAALSWREGQGLFESHLARDVDVEQVHLPVLHATQQEVGASEAACQHLQRLSVRYSRALPAYSS
jgi:hypothetical protein